MNAPAWLTPFRLRIGCYALAGCALGVGIVQFPALVTGVFMGAPEDRVFDHALARARVAQHAHAQALDAMSHEATKARIVYVGQRRSFTDAVAGLPPAFISTSATSDSAMVQIRAETFIVARPVAEYVGQLRDALDKAPLAVTAADSALSKTVAEAAQARTNLAESDSLTAAVVEHEKGARPGFFGRAWSAIRMPVYVGAGFVGGVVVARIAQ